MNAVVERLRDTSAPSVEELLDRARRLAPLLKERAGKAEQLRRVPDETIRDYNARHISGRGAGRCLGEQ